MSTPQAGSRLTFPEDRTAFVYGRPGDPIRTPPRTAIKLFLDEAGQSPADVRTLAGLTIAYSTIYTGDDALLPEFLGPEGFVTRLWARVVGGTGQAYPLMAQYSDQLALLPTIGSGDGPPSPDFGAVGSFYIDTDPQTDPNTTPDPLLYGPRTVDGWPSIGTPLRGRQGLPGNARVWQQSVASDRWEVPHTIAYPPSVTTIDSAGDEVFGDVSYPSAYLVVISFSSPFGGTAVLT